MSLIYHHDSKDVRTLVTLQWGPLNGTIADMPRLRLHCSADRFKIPNCEPWTHSNEPMSLLFSPPNDYVKSRLKACAFSVGLKSHGVASVCECRVVSFIVENVIFWGSVTSGSTFVTLSLQLNWAWRAAFAKTWYLVHWNAYTLHMLCWHTLLSFIYPSSSVREPGRERKLKTERPECSSAEITAGILLYLHHNRWGTPDDEGCY